MITSPIVTNNAIHRISAELGRSASIILEGFSNGGNIVASVFKVINGSRDIISRGNISMAPTLVPLPVFNHLIPTEGVSINISVLVQDTDDFDFYDVVLSNDVGNSSVRIYIGAQGNAND